MRDNSMFSERILKAALPNEENYMRLQITLNKPIGLDEIQRLDDLKREAVGYVSDLACVLKKIDNILNEIVPSPKTPKAKAK